MAVIPVIRLALGLLLIGLLSVQVHGGSPKTNDNSNSTDSKSRSYGGTAKFQEAGWKVWDNFQDQLAIEAGKGKETVASGHRRAKQANSTGQSGHALPEETTRVHNAEKYGMKRQGCNTNLQVSVLPIVLALIAVVSGVIGIFVLWIIAKSWFAIGNGVSSLSSSFGTGGSHQQVSSGWGQQRRDTLGFTRSLQNVDFDQLTKIVSQAVDTYHSIFDAKPKKS